MDIVRAIDLKKSLTDILNEKFLNKPVDKDLTKRILAEVDLFIGSILSQSKGDIFTKDVSYGINIYEGRVFVLPQNFFTALLINGVFFPYSLWSDINSIDTEMGKFEWKDGSLFFQPMNDPKFVTVLTKNKISDELSQKTNT